MIFSENVGKKRRCLGNFKAHAAMFILTFLMNPCFLSITGIYQRFFPHSVKHTAFLLGTSLATWIMI